MGAPERRGARAMPRLRALAAALVVATAQLAIPAAGPAPVGALGTLPECRLDDILTVPRDYDDYGITLVDWILSLGPGYKPPDLVSVRNGGVAGGGYVREVVIDDLRAMARAAERNGTPLVSWSPYRSYKQQKKLFNIYARGYGFDEAVTFSARPGHSEHQLGVTIDFVAVGDVGLTSNWEKTPTGAWMAGNAWKYGWLMSYPKGRSDVTCYGYEPWHYRYVGPELAEQIHDSGLTIREYLWANYTLVDPTTGEPLPTATVAPSTSPSASPGVGPTSAPTGPGGATSPPSSPAATSPPTADAGTWFGFDPAVVVASLLLVLASIGLIVSLGQRRPRRG